MCDVANFLVEVCDKATNYILIFTTQLSRLSKISRYLAIIIISCINDSLL